ncbi:MAG: hypothetical protein HOB79_03210 [Rhodospirillaceae bacterium]|nr:hypothetical protein [Rhodospirillaceae bacterium]
MSKYIRPDLGKNSLAYRGLRYWLIEIAPDNEFEGWKKSDCDFVLFDCLLGGLVALAKKNEGGRISGKIIAHVETDTHEFSSLRDAAKGLAAEAEGYGSMVDG